MYKTMYVEYIDHMVSETRQTEIMDWTAFCEACCEYGFEVLFCCATDDPRVNMN